MRIKLRLFPNDVLPYSRILSAVGDVRHDHPGEDVTITIEHVTREARPVPFPGNIAPTRDTREKMAWRPPSPLDYVDRRPGAVIPVDSIAEGQALQREASGRRRYESYTGPLQWAGPPRPIRVGDRINYLSPGSNGMWNGSVVTGFVKSGMFEGQYYVDSPCGLKGIISDKMAELVPCGD